MEKKPLQIYFSERMREKIKVAADNCDITEGSYIKTVIAEKLNK